MGSNKTNRKSIGRHSPGVAAALLLSIVGLAFFIVVQLNPTITGQVVAGTTMYVSGMTFGLNCSISLAAGWNLISIPCSTANSSVAYMLSGISGNYSSIHSYEASDGADHWKSYKPGLPSWVDQDITAINPEKGYWIKMTGLGRINMTGTISLPYRMQLIAGWNLVGYPTGTSHPPSESFAAINSSISSVHAFNATDTSDSWKAYYPGIGGNDLALIAPYFGYWINASSPVQWELPLE